MRWPFRRKVTTEHEAPAKGIKGATFDWLYIDFETLAYYATAAGLKCVKCTEGSHYDYVARISW